MKTALLANAEMQLHFTVVQHGAAGLAARPKMIGGVFFGGLFGLKGLNFWPDEIINPVHGTDIKKEETRGKKLGVRAGNKKPRKSGAFR